MIETLIAALVLSIGLVGYMRLLQSDLQNSDSAAFRGQAAMMIGNMFDRLRSDRNVAMDGDYNIAIGDSISGDDSVATALTEWRDDLADALPEGSGGVACDSDTGACAITVTWDDSRGIEGDADQTLVMRSLLE